MFFLVIPALLIGLVLAWGLGSAFRMAEKSADANARRALEVIKSFLLWLIVGALPLLFVFLSGASRTWDSILTSLEPELPMALIGTAILWFAVPAKKSAFLFGLIIGVAIAPLTLWTLALILPKNELTMGLALYGIILALPNGLAGAIVGHWRAQSGVVPADMRPRPLAL
jgi:hypothetical protein